MTKKPATRPAPVAAAVNHAPIINLARALIEARIQLAEKRGYIERVHDEAAARPPRPDQEPVTDGIQRLRSVVAYSTDKEASQVIEALSPELLERVLGGPGTGRTGDSDIR